MPLLRVPTFRLLTRLQMDNRYSQEAQACLPCGRQVLHMCSVYFCSTLNTVRLFDEGDLDPAPCTPKKTARIHATRSGGRASSPNHYKKLGDYDEEDLPDINDTFQ